MTGFLARNRAITRIVLAVALLVVLLTWLNRDKAYPDQELHPENPEPNGARAVAEVLRDRGVAVAIARDEAQLRDQTIDSASTVMVTSTSYLGDDTAATFVELTSQAGTLVITLPPPRLLSALAEGTALGAGEDGVHDARCEDPLLGGLTIEVRRSPTYQAPGADECFDALVLRDGRRYLVGGADLFTNRSILEADNAAVALRLLGGHDRLIWYVPDPADVGASGGATIRELLPRWLWPSLLLVGFALVALVLWRGRRLGPVSVEPLPVVVRNSEAVEARGRLYRRSRDRGHVARSLRNGTTDRLAAHLAVPPSTSAALLHQEVARATGRSAADVAALLQHAPVDDDAGLVRLAGDLSALEAAFDPDKEVAP